MFNIKRKVILSVIVISFISHFVYAAPIGHPYPVSRAIIRINPTLSPTKSLPISYKLSQPMRLNDANLLKSLNIKKISELNEFSVEEIIENKGDIPPLSSDFPENLSKVTSEGLGILIKNSDGYLNVVSLNTAIIEQTKQVDKYIKQGDMINAFNVLNQNQKLITTVSVIIEQNYKNSIKGLKEVSKTDLENVKFMIDGFSAQLNAIEKEVHLYGWLLSGLLGLFGVDTIIRRMRKGRRSDIKKDKD